MANTAIHVDHVARIEGHGSVHVVIEDNQVKTCQMEITEPARFFESMVRGRIFSDVPYISSRICGICSSSHTVTDLLAIEDAFGIQVSDRTHALRELLIYGSYLQNHATHLFVFAAPDFLGRTSVFPLADIDRNLFDSALALKALGNELCTKVGGRSVHPITAVVGGFTAEMTRDEYLEMADKLEAMQDFAVTVIDLFRSFKIQDIQMKGDMLAMVDEGGYPVSTSRKARFVKAGIEFDAADAVNQIEEYPVSYSGALLARVKQTGEPFMTGALARVNASWNNLSKTAKIASAKGRLRPPEANPMMNNLAQAVEVVDALGRCAELCRRLAANEFEGTSKVVDFEVRAGRGVGFTEAPRGVLFHDLTFDDQGRVEKATILTPTALNVASLEADMLTLAEKLVEMGAEEAEIKMEIEKLVRAYDPCMSCSVH